ncbi:DUF3102 domain-containing protein [Paenibacillus sp. FSL R5-0908]|uniref:DUF3102 domain-containing protein n=1 Tax=Paenibacillus sp. FSL R5-0908 TaxID=2921664 RepID=UPI0030FCE95B
MMNELSKSLDVITAEINSYKQVAGQSLFEIGKRLQHVKENDLAHGEWESWLKSIDLVPQTARKFIQAYEQFGNRAMSSDLPTGKLFEMLSLPETVDREEFIKQVHVIPSTGETKSVDEMTVKELREVKKSLNDAKKEKELAEQRAKSAEFELRNANNEKAKFERMWKEEKDKPTQVITEIKKEVVTPDDYEELLKQAFLAQKLNNEVVLLKRAANDMRAQYEDKLTTQNKKDSSTRELQKYLSEQLRALTMNHDSAILNYKIIQGDREAHEIVMKFLSKYEEIIKRQVAEWDELTSLKAVK